LLFVKVAVICVVIVLRIVKQSSQQGQLPAAGGCISMSSCDVLSATVFVIYLNTSARKNARQMAQNCHGTWSLQ
jgi:shikimate kinase